MNRVRHSPPDIGGVDATSRRSREASFNGADGVVENGTISSKEGIPKHFGTPNHPVCAVAVASHLFLDGAGHTSYVRRGIASLTLIHSFYDRAYKRFHRFATASYQEGSSERPTPLSNAPFKVAAPLIKRAV